MNLFWLRTSKMYREITVRVYIRAENTLSEPN